MPDAYDNSSLKVTVVGTLSHDRQTGEVIHVTFRGDELQKFAVTFTSIKPQL